MKFSIIIPVYNVRNYLEKCLLSIMNQTYDNYDCILVCDKSVDNSDYIVEKYLSIHKKFKKITVNNIGLSESRNIGIEEAHGDYLLFLDGDDYYEQDLLKILNQNLTDKPDILRFQVKEVFEEKQINYHEEPFEITSGIEAFNKINKYHFIENAWAYCYKRSFFLKNKFQFMKGCIAEDFGLIPLIIAKAPKVKSIDYIGYNYVQREGSLMNNTSYERHIKKMNDMIAQAKNLYKEFSTIKNNEKFLQFINNSLIYFSTSLKYKDFKKFKKELKYFNIYDYIPNDNLKRKIKKILIKCNAYLYYNFIQRYLWKR